MNKKTGYLLLWGGIGIILCSVMLTWKVFSGAVPPPQLVDLKEIILPLPTGQVAMPLDPQYSKVANISLYLLFMFFVSAAGNKISKLGITLLKADKPEPARTEPPKPQA